MRARTTCQQLYNHTIAGFEGESFKDAFKRLAVDVNAKYPFINIVCIISQDIPNIPVSLNGHLYD